MVFNMTEIWCIASAQINCTVDDLNANRSKIIEYAERAKDSNIDNDYTKGGWQG
jgi:predicted amidohydrolase